MLIIETGQCKHDSVIGVPSVSLSSLNKHSWYYACDILTQLAVQTFT